MDIKLFFTIFGAVFLAELGDKTQIAALTMSAKNPGQTWTIWAAVVGALVLAGTLGVLAGKMLGQHLNPTLTTKLSGLVFLFMGVWILWRS